MSNLIKVLNPVGGVSGDMFVAAAYSAGVFEVGELEQFIKGNFPTRLAIGFKSKPDCGVVATEMHVHFETEEFDQHRGLSDVLSYADCGSWSAAQREIYRKIFTVLANAEACVHGIDLSSVHFHEVGALDSILDIAAAAFIIDRLGIQDWYYHPLPYATGVLGSEHGILPAFAPATRRLLHGFEFAAAILAGESITPTGAAILRFLNPRPIRDWKGGGFVRDGIGKGRRDGVDRPNVLYLDIFSGDESFLAKELASEVCFEIDDMTAEDIAKACDRLRLVDGVWDLISYPVFGKKGRIATSIRLLVSPACAQEVIDKALDWTSTIGVRVDDVCRQLLSRESLELRNIPTKVVRRPSGSTFKAESDAVALLSVRETQRLTMEMANEFFGQ